MNENQDTLFEDIVLSKPQEALLLLQRLRHRISVNEGELEVVEMCRSEGCEKIAALKILRRQLYNHWQSTNLPVELQDEICKRIDSLSQDIAQMQEHQAVLANRLVNLKLDLRSMKTKTYLAEASLRGDCARNNKSLKLYNKPFF